MSTQFLEGDILKVKSREQYALVVGNVSTEIGLLIVYLTNADNDFMDGVVPFLSKELLNSTDYNRYEVVCNIKPILQEVFGNGT